MKLTIGKIKKIVIGCILLLGLQTSACAVRNIYVYDGQGIFWHCVNITMAAIRANVNPQEYRVLQLRPEELIEGAWRKDGALFVMPSVRVGDCLQQMGDVGMQQIQDYVFEGGSYLGLCGGGYFGSRHIYFTEPTGAVKKRNGLGLYKGAARGPVFAAFSPTEQTAQLVFTEWSSSGASMPSLVYWNGGSAFVNDNSVPFSSTTEILANYVFSNESRGQQPWEELLRSQNVPQEDLTNAMVYCQHGKGKVVLSGIHPETSAACLGKMAEYLECAQDSRAEDYSELYSVMMGSFSDSEQSCDALRELLLRQILERLGITLNEQTQKYSETE